MWDREKDGAIGEEAVVSDEAVVNDQTIAMSAEMVASPPSSHRGLIPGDRVGPYRIVREVGRGGMAEVYHAARADRQFEQKVALKVLQPDRVSRLTIQRFEQERQIVASLSHPNIAGLLDGGVTDDGRPYFAMEFVEGLPLDEYCDAHRLGVADRLRLFLTVARAVHHAHQNLWVHRDLKPANILVTDDGQVKLLDFGIAKLIEQEDASAPAGQRMADTAVHQTSFWMTPQYASPEQLRGEAITTAADQYQLGLILFEMLTGRLPYDLATAPLVEVIRIVCELEPIPPSTVVLRSSQSFKPSPTSTRSVWKLRQQEQDGIEPGVDSGLAQVGRSDTTKAMPAGELSGERGGEPSRSAGGAQRSPLPPPSFLPNAEDLAWFRGSSPKRLQKRLRGDLDAIVERCLRKNPKGRYGSVEQMLDDIELHLDGLPVGVRSGLAYRSRRFLWRHRWAVGAAAVFFLWMIGYAVTVTQQSRRIAEERDRAQLAAAEAEEVKAFLIDLFQVADPTEHLGEEVTVKRLLDRGASRIDDQLTDQPVVRAEMLHVIGTVYLRLGEYDQADALLSQSLELRRQLNGAESLAITQVLNDLAMLYRDLGSYRRSESVHREVLRIRRRHLGYEHPKVAGSLHNLARVLELQGSFEEAEQFFREALDMDLKIHGTDLHRDVSYDLASLGVLLSTLGRYDEAGEMIRRGLEIRRELYGEDHPIVAKSRRSLSDLSRELGELETAEQLATKSLNVHRRIYGDQHIEVAKDLHQLGLVARDAGRLDEASERLVSAIEIFERSLGSSHPSTLLSRSALGSVRVQEGRPEAGLEEYGRVLELSGSTLPVRHPDTAEIYHGYGLCLGALGRSEEARTALNDALELRIDLFGESHPRTEEIRADLQTL